MNPQVLKNSSSDGDSQHPTAALEKVSYEPYISPFQSNIQNWMAENGFGLGGLVVGLRGCGLQGQIDFKREVFENVVREEFRTFWSSLTPKMAAAFEKHRMGIRNFFTESAFTMLQAMLLNGVRKGIIPHPDGKKPHDVREGKPGSLEDDCARALASMGRDLSDRLTEVLKYYSSRDVENDRFFIHAMSEYLGLGPSMEALLEARVLDHYGLPNIYQASHYGALLNTALGQVFGIDWKETTAEAVIEDQPRRHEWPAAYLQLPLLDAVLASSYYSYDATGVEAFYDDTYPRDKGEKEKRVAEARVITKALHEFRARLLGAVEG